MYANVCHAQALVDTLRRVLQDEGATAACA
jgi:hypothetical protein